MRIYDNEPLSRLGYWRVGGPIDRFVLVDNVAELATLESPLVLGNGSNLLAPDEGLRGTVVRLGGELRELRILDEDRGVVRVRVGGGLLNAVLLARLARAGLCGASMLAGVPGTVGGAVAMNAGTVLGEISDILESIDGTGGPIERAALPMHYREGGLPRGYVVTAAVLRLRRDGFEDEQVRMTTHLARRKASQPLDLPSCGSVFRNPPGDFAGRLVELAGLKGHRIGGAQISPRHANFIVNLGDATASQVMGCIRAAWAGVRDATGIELEPEVRVVGDWPADVWPLAR